MTVRTIKGHPGESHWLPDRVGSNGIFAEGPQVPIVCCK